MVETSTPETMEKPENGRAGLRHWRYDLVSGMQVALVSLPLSLGIAIASGAPPVTGIVSAVIAGLIYPFIGGAYVTISGPAAGLAPALLSGMLTLGGGELEAGYPLLLVAIFLTGLVQLALAFFRAGRFAAFFPQTVVEAMLSAIGIIIIIKQLPLFLGITAPPRKTIVESLSVLPGQAEGLQMEIFLIGALSLALMFALNRIKKRWFKIIPPALSVSVVGMALGVVLGLESKYLIHIPDTLGESIRLPDFGAVLSRSELWWSMGTIVIMLTLIDGIESLATVQAVDKIDPWQRKSNPNRTLAAMGLSNLLSSLVGGLTIIPGGIKSRANVDGGGRTLWANFYNALFLLLFFFFARDFINRIPLATLAGVLMFIGWRLCEPRVFLRALSTGKDQMLIFVVTIAAILLTDLLWGIMIGIVLYVLLLHALLSPSLRDVVTGRLGFVEGARLVWNSFLTLFRDPVIRTNVGASDGKAVHEVHLSSLFNTNLLKLQKRLVKLPPDADVTIVLSRSGRMICHTAMEYLHHFQEQLVQRGGACEIRGLDHYRPFSDHPMAARMHDPEIARQKVILTVRQNRMKQFAFDHGLTFSPVIESSLNEHRFIYLDLGSDKQVRNLISGSCDGLKIRVFDYSFLREPLSYLETRRTMIMVNAVTPVPDFLLYPESGREQAARHAPGLRVVPIPEYARFSAQYLVHGNDESVVRTFLATKERILFFEKHPKFYVEARAGVILAFRVDRDLEHVGDIPLLLTVAEKLGRP